MLRIVCTSASGGVDTVVTPFAPVGDMHTFDGNGNLVVAESDGVELGIYDSRSGERAGYIAAPFERAAVSDDRWRAATKPLSSLRNRADVACNPAVERPAMEPALRAVLAGDGSRIWLEAYGVAGPQLLTIDVARAIVDATSMPTRDIGVNAVARGNRILFVSRDARGRPQITSYHRRY
jgi:hypothetical protein